MSTSTFIATPDPDRDPNSTDPHRGRDNVVHLHPAGAGTTEAAGAAVEPLVLDGELIDDPVGPAAGSGRPGTALVRRAGAVTRRQTVHVITTLRESERPAQGARLAARTGVTVVQGFESWARRAWDATTMGVYRRQIRAAEAVGDQQRLAEWLERKETAAQRRHAWFMDLPAMVAAAVRVMLGAAAALAVLILAVGGVVQLSGAGEFTAVITATSPKATSSPIWVHGSSVTCPPRTWTSGSPTWHPCSAPVPCGCCTRS